MELYQCVRCGKAKWEDEMHQQSYASKKTGLATISYYTCKDCILETKAKYRNSHKDYLSDYQSTYHRKLKLEVLSHYSGSPPRCMKCSFEDIRALSIDHILGGGSYHRRSDGLLSQRLYSWLKKQSYPEGYQVLCMNCQFIKRHENKEWRLE